MEFLGSQQIKAFIMNLQICCLQIYSLKHQLSGVKNEKRLLYSDLQMLRTYPSNQGVQIFRLKISQNLANLQSSGTHTVSPNLTTSGHLMLKDQSFKFSLRFS